MSSPAIGCCRIDAHSAFGKGGIKRFELVFGRRAWYGKAQKRLMAAFCAICILHSYRRVGGKGEIRRLRDGREFRAVYIDGYEEEATSFCPILRLLLSASARVAAGLNGYDAKAFGDLFCECRGGCMDASVGAIVGGEAFDDEVCLCIGCAGRFGDRAVCQSFAQ